MSRVFQIILRKKKGPHQKEALSFKEADFTGVVPPKPCAARAGFLFLIMG